MKSIDALTRLVDLARLDHKQYGDPFAWLALRPEILDAEHQNTGVYFPATEMSDLSVAYRLWLETSSCDPEDLLALAEPVLRLLATGPGEPRVRCLFLDCLQTEKGDAPKAIARFTRLTDELVHEHEQTLREQWDASTTENVPVPDPGPQALGPRLAGSGPCLRRPG